MNNLDVTKSWNKNHVKLSCLFCGEDLDIYDVKDGEIDLDHEEGENPYTVKEGYSVAPDNCNCISAGDENFINIQDGRIILATYDRKRQDITDILPDDFKKIYIAYNNESKF